MRPVPSPAPIRPLTALSRGLRERCPRCGVGDVFAASRGLEGRRDCAACGWRLVRSDGHWIGGAEINICATFVVGVLVAGAALFAFGNEPLVYAAGALFVTAFGLAAQRRSRALFFAVDYLIDPLADDDERTGPGEPREFLEPLDDAPPKPPGRHARAPREPTATY